MMGFIVRGVRLIVLTTPVVVASAAVAVGSGAGRGSLAAPSKTSDRSAKAPIRATDAPREVGTHSGLVSSTGPWPFAGMTSDGGDMSGLSTLPGARVSMRASTGTCATLDSNVEVKVTLKDAPSPIIAGQVLVKWDPSQLRLDGVRPGSDPFNVAYSLNQTAGTAIVLASVRPGSGPYAGGGSASPCDAVWQRVATAAPGGYEIAYDESRSRTVLVADGKTYEWNGVSWEMKSASGPPSRGAGALVYDPNGRRCLMFGGYGSGGVLNDLWSWNGTAWTQLNTGQIPARGDFAMAFDAKRNRLVVHGGYNLSSLMADTCEWNPVTNAWTRIASGPIGNRYAHRMAWDAGLGKIMLHGGYNFYNRGDTWSWDGSNWVQIATNGPARYVFGMAYDTRRNEMVIHGGTSCCTEVEYTETYRFRGGAWQLCSSAGPARGYIGMAYDSGRDALIFSGGMGPSPTGRIGFAETWEVRLGGAPVEIDVAKLDFHVMSESCTGDGTAVTYYSAATMRTLFTDGNGSTVIPVALEDSQRFIVDTRPPVFSGVLNEVRTLSCAGVECGSTISFLKPTAADSCAPVGSVAVNATRSDGRAFTDPWSCGVTRVTWSAADLCGNTAVATTDVTVSSDTFARVRVSSVGSASYAPDWARCVSLRFSGRDGSAPLAVDRTLEVALNASGTGEASIQLPGGLPGYSCVIAEDGRHSLKTRTSVSVDGCVWAADVKLVLGNITGPGNVRDDVIDVLDWGAYVVRYGLAADSGSCGGSAVHADLNGNGLVDAADGDVILANFGRVSDAPCMAITGDVSASPIVSISMRELMQLGMSELVAADLNGDGWLDGRDMKLFERVRATN